MENKFGIVPYSLFVGYSSLWASDEATVAALWVREMHFSTAENSTENPHQKYLLNYFRRKVKFSHSLEVVRLKGLEAHCILGTMYERRCQSLCFRCLILPWFEQVPLTAGLTEKDSPNLGLNS